MIVRYSILTLLCTLLIIPNTSWAKDEKRVSKSAARHYEQRQPEIDKLDTNEDGILQPEEVQAGIKEKFDAADINQDGVISAEESQTMIKDFKKDKQETYGQLTNRNAKRLKNRLNNVDKNDDGIITSEEYDAYYGVRYKKMDKDKDGTINLKEYRTDVEPLNRRKRRR